MELKVEPSGSLEGEVKAPPSKSCTHRAVIIASLADGVSGISEPLLSSDTKASIRACKQLGAGVSGNLKIKGVSGNLRNPNGINVDNSGTTIRILTSVCSTLDEKVTLTGDLSIQKRPMQPLLDALGQLGVKTNSNNGCAPVTVRGPIINNICSIPGNVSSQYISGLLIAGGLTCMEIRVTTEMKSKPYVDLTLDLMERFGVKVENNDYKGFTVGKGTYKATEYTVEGDYSGAAFLLSAAALTDSDVVVKNLFKDSKQGDKKIVEILKEMGADIKVSKDSVRVRGGNELHGIDMDLSQTPDLMPIASVLGALGKGKTLLHSVEHARFKESDRIDAMSRELKKMGAKIEEKKDGMILEGVKELKGAKMKGYHDHRIVMALAVAGLRADKASVIEGAESIPVSFPGFKEVMKRLGGKLN